MKKDRRLELLVGYRCNNNCKFCYVHADDGEMPNKSTLQLKGDIDKSRERGTTEIAFLGGEPTIRKDIFELIRYAKSKGFQQVKLTTNGRMLSYPWFVDKLVDAGVTKILFSIHGPNAEIHDKLTQVKGSFDQLMKGIENVKKYSEVIIETNSTMTKENIEYLPDMARLFVKLGMWSSEVIFVFPKGNALKYVKDVVPRYSDASEFMVEAIEIGKESKTKILMRYVPYCILPHHIEYIADQFDPAEREQLGPDVETLDVIKARKELDRAQVEQCEGCKFQLECEGPWKNYPEFYGIDEFKRL